MRRVVYVVAVSLDGYIAGPNGEFDWIVHDPTADFGALYARFDSVFLGRRTYELTQQPGAPPWPDNWRVFVFSRTLRQADHPSVTVVSTDIGATVAALRSQPGRDIWLFGGGSLFASLLAADVVDEVEVAVNPIVLGKGVPLVGPEAPRTSLTLKSSKSSPVGVVTLTYEIRR